MSGGRMTFFFDAAACSGCKACQVACKDRHGLETGRLWRRVSEVAGGGWNQDGAAWRNDVFAYHLSMSCNHCERPICLEGCPARAITRRPDGVVLIEPDHCLGCGYCGWVCPYSAPQYDAARGVMSKCSFCVDDLDSGLEPACVAACPVRVLDAGEPEELAARHGEPGGAEGLAPLPPADLTEPALHLAPHAHAGRSTEPDVELTPRPPRGLREWSLIVFTVLAQAAAGLVIVAGGLRWGLGWRGEQQSLDPVLLPAALGLMMLAMAASTLHLGRPRNSVRSLMNLGASWLSREILLASIFVVTVTAAWVAPVAAVATVAAWFSVPVAAAFLVGMAKVYTQRTVPAWNRWRTPLVFAATALFTGGLVANALMWSPGHAGIEQTRPAGLVVLALCVVGVGGPWSVWRLLRGETRPGSRPLQLVGSLGVAAGLALFLLLAARPDVADTSVPAILSWTALTLALVDQFGQRREFYGRYERVGI